MRFETLGEKAKPFIIMLPGSFCPADSMQDLYTKLKEDFYILAPTYNGNYQGSKDFTTRQNEAAEIVQFVREQHIDCVQMIYGQSMGAEIGIELMYQLLNQRIEVKSAFFDGAPCIRLSKIYKAIMYRKFKMMISMFGKKTLDEALNMSIVRKFSKGDTEAYRPMIEPIIRVAPFITDTSIKNQNECCYTFDFPPFDEETQKQIHFLYAKQEKAYRSCIKGVRKAYPMADYTIIDGYGHLTYAAKHPDEYIQMLKKSIG